MLTQILAMVVALALTYCLLRLRHFILACGKDKRKYYRAYIVRFEETDWDSGPDDKLNDGTDDTLAHWPTELEIQTDPSNDLKENPDEAHAAAATAQAPGLPRK